jgi:hypothetical protein
MTHSELKSRLASCCKVQKRWNLIVLAALLGFPMLLILLGERANPFLGLFACAFGGVFLVWLFVIWRSIRVYGLACPHCGKPLTHRYPVVASTGTCGHCARSVIDVPV